MSDEATPAARRRGRRNAGLFIVGIGALILFGRGSAYAKNPLPYGPKWKDVPPPGWDPSRLTGVAGGAERLVRAAVRATRVRQSSVLEAVLVQLCRTESGCMFRRPANNYCRPCSYPDKITAEGAFQWQDRLWRGVTDSGQHVWQTSVDEEVHVPVLRYVAIWQAALGRGANTLDAARTVRAWHVKASYGPAMLDYLGAGGIGWAPAVSAATRAKVDRHLDALPVALV